MCAFSSVLLAFFVDSNLLNHFCMSVRHDFNLIGVRAEVCVAIKCTYLPYILHHMCRGFNNQHSMWYLIYIIVIVHCRVASYNKFRKHFSYVRTLPFRFHTSLCSSPEFLSTRIYRSTQENRIRNICTHRSLYLCSHHHQISPDSRPLSI